MPSAVIYVIVKWEETIAEFLRWFELWLFLNFDGLTFLIGLV